MRTIWKFPLELTRAQIVMMPSGAKILCVQVQDNTPCLWAEVNSEAALERKLITMCGTGGTVNDATNSVYIGTVQLPPFVWHFYGPT